MKLALASVSDLLWLVVVVALALGWWLDHERTAVFEDDIELQMLDTKITYAQLKKAVESGHPEWVDGGPVTNSGGMERPSKGP
jgi:hypothetical protein